MCEALFQLLVFCFLYVIDRIPLQAGGSVYSCFGKYVKASVIYTALLSRCLQSLAIFFCSFFRVLAFCEADGTRTEKETTYQTWHL